MKLLALVRLEPFAGTDGLFARRVAFVLTLVLFFRTLPVLSILLLHFLLPLS